MSDSVNNAAAPVMNADAAVVAAPAPAPVQGAEPTQDAPADFVAKVINVRIYTDETNGNTLYLRLNKKFKKMSKGEDLVYREEDTQELSIFPNQLLDILREDDSISMYLSYLNDVFGKRFNEFKVMMSSAVVVIEFKKHLKGSVVDNVTLDRDKIYANVKSITLGKLTRKMVDNTVEKIVNNEIPFVME